MRFFIQIAFFFCISVYAVEAAKDHTRSESQKWEAVHKRLQNKYNTFASNAANNDRIQQFAFAQQESMRKSRASSYQNSNVNSSNILKEREVLAKHKRRKCRGSGCGCGT